MTSASLWPFQPVTSHFPLSSLLLVDATSIYFPNMPCSPPHTLRGFSPALFLAWITLTSLLSLPLFWDHFGSWRAESAHHQGASPGGICPLGPEKGTSQASSQALSMFQGLTWGWRWGEVGIRSELKFCWGLQPRSPDIFSASKQDPCYTSSVKEMHVLDCQDHGTSQCYSKAEQEWNQKQSMCLELDEARKT